MENIVDPIVEPKFQQIQPQKYTESFYKKLNQIQKRLKFQQNQAQFNKNNIYIENYFYITPRNYPSKQNLEKLEKIRTNHFGKPVQINPKILEKNSQSSNLDLSQQSGELLSANNFQAGSQSFVPITENIDFLVVAELKTKNLIPTFKLNPSLCYYHQKYEAYYRIGQTLEPNKQCQNLSAGYQLGKNLFLQYDLEREHRNSLKKGVYYHYLTATYKHNYQIFYSSKYTNQVGIRNIRDVQILKQKFKVKSEICFDDNKSVISQYNIGGTVGIHKKFEDIGIKISLQHQKTLFLERSQIQMKVALQKLYNLLVNFEYCSSHYTMYLGFQKQSFKLALPVYNVRLETLKQIGIAIGLTSGIIFGTFLYKKKLQKSLQKLFIKLKNKILRKEQNIIQDQSNGEQEKKALEEQIEKNRKINIQLISNKANQNYQNELKKQNGLIIKEAYYGDENEIKLLAQQQNKISYLFKNTDAKIIDVTIPIRFYVNNSKLQLYCQENKMDSLIGFKKMESATCKLYITYQNDQSGQTQEAIFSDGQVIAL